MTQHGTSVVIKQTNEGPGSAELDVLHVVAGDQKNGEKAAEASCVHPFPKEATLSKVCGAGAKPRMH